MENTDSLLQFPCEYPLKVIGRSAEELHLAVREIVSKHVPEAATTRYSSRPSRHHNYVSVTVSITAESRAQLDALYQELNDHELVLMTL